MMNAADEAAKSARARDKGVVAEQRPGRQKAADPERRRRSSAKASITAPGKKRWIKGLMVVLTLVVLLIVIGVVVRGRGDTASTDLSDASEPAAALGDLPVTATELFNAYEANAAAAQQEYAGVTLLVSGIVDAVEIDALNKPVVKLRTSDASMSMPAGLTEASQQDASKLSPGEQITLRCAVSAASGTPMLESCAIQ